MPFSRAVADELLAKAHRHCCVCHKPAGQRMEIHHIVREAQGGDDSLENGIPLCFDCHAEAGAYDANHPRGRKFTPNELRKHRDQWFQIMSAPRWEQPAIAATPVGPSQSVHALLEQLGNADLWNPDNRRFLGSVRALAGEERRELVTGLADAIASPNEKRRWDTAIVVEFLVEWDPRRIPDELLETMAEDLSFSVRSSAAVSYAYLATSAPDRVPVEVLGRLAQLDEDWYVMTPALSALRRLARTRAVAVEVLMEGVADEDQEVAERYADELLKLVRERPAAANWNLVETLEKDPRLFAQEVAARWREILTKRTEEGLGNDLGIF